MMVVAPPFSSLRRRVGSSCLLLVACLCLVSSLVAAGTATVEQEVTVDPIGFVGQRRRSLQVAPADPATPLAADPGAATTPPPSPPERFRSDCLYDVTVYMDIRGGSVNQYDQILFGGPSTPGGALTIGNGQTAEGGSPATFNLLDGGNTGWLQIEYNTQSCGAVTVDLTAPIDTYQFGPHKRIVCGGGLFTLFMKLRVFLQNPQCLLAYSTGGIKKQPLTISALPATPLPADAAAQEACIFQVSKYTDYTFENTASFKTPALNEEFITSPQTQCYTSADGSFTECDTFQLYEYNDGQNGEKKYLATVTSNHTTQCVANHETMSPVSFTETITPGNGNFDGSSFRQLVYCDGSEGYTEANVGAAYFWWMTVHVLNPDTCTTLTSATIGPLPMEPANSASFGGTPDTDAPETAATTRQFVVDKDSGKLMSSSSSPPKNITLWDLDQFILQATTTTDDGATTGNDNNQINNNHDDDGTSGQSTATTTTTTTQSTTTNNNNNKSSASKSSVLCNQQAAATAVGGGGLVLILLSVMGLL